MVKIFSVNFAKLFRTPPVATARQTAYQNDTRCFILGMDAALNKWGRIFKNGPSKISGRQSLKNFTRSILEYFAPNEVPNLGINLTGNIPMTRHYYILCNIGSKERNLKRSVSPDSSIIRNVRAAT